MKSLSPLTPLRCNLVKNRRFLTNQREIQRPDRLSDTPEERPGQCWWCSTSTCDPPSASAGSGPLAIPSSLQLNLTMYLGSYLDGSASGMDANWLSTLAKLNYPV